MISHLQLRHTSFTEVSIAVCENGTFEGESSLTHNLNCGLLDGNPRLWRLEMCVELKTKPSKPFAYTGKICVVGIIEAHPDIPEDKVQHSVQLAGASLLYGAIREMVLNITSRSAKGVLMMPTLNFQAILSEKKTPEKLPAKTVASHKA